MDLDSDNPLAIELRQEMAEAYFAACRKMVDSLEALKAFDRNTAPSTLNSDQATRRTDLIADAAERVYFVVIQREAMKLTVSEQFFEGYDIPNEIRSRLGPKRRPR